MSLTLLEPLCLWGLLVVPVLWMMKGQSVSVRVCSLRSLVFAALILGICQPVIVSSDSAPAVHIIIVDGASAAKDMAESIRERSAGVEVALLESADGSPIGSLLADAARRIATDRSGMVTLISDGLATDSSWQRAAMDLIHRGIPVHVIAVDRVITAAYVTRIRSRSELRVGQTASIEVTVAAGGMSGRVELKAGGRVVAESAPMTIADEASVWLEFEPGEAGFIDLTAVFSGDAGFVGTDLTRTFAVQRPLSVVYLGGRLGGSELSLSDLLGSGFEVVPTDGSDTSVLDGADLVVIDDRKSSDVPLRFQEALTAAVIQRGLGLVVAGGRAAFGPGGYHDTPIEKILPVEFIQKEEKKDPSTALAVIIDTSGSMGGNRIRLAKEVARLAIRRLLPHDKVGIVEFYGAKRWAAPLQSAANAIDIQRALNRLDAGGGTVLLPAVEEAFYGLKNVKTRYKHCLILTDGGVESGPYEALMRRMAKDGICVSTVLVGPGRHSEFLVELASWGNGRYYNASNRFNLPEVMLKQPSTSRLPAWRTGSFSVIARGGPRWWGGSVPESIPALNGYVETRSHDGSLTLMETVRDHHPVLTTWRHGLGRVTAFMTEPTGAGTKNWNDWAGYGAALGQVFLATASGSREVRRRYRVERIEGEVVVTATGGPQDSLPGAHRIEQSGLSQKPLEFRRRATRTYVGRLLGNGAATVRIATNDGTFLVSDTLDVSRPENQVPAELAIPLARLAAASGGTYQRATGNELELTARTTRAGRTARVLWPWLLLFGLFVYLIEIFVRRRSQSVVEPS